MYTYSPLFHLHVRIVMPRIVVSFGSLDLVPVLF